MDGAALRPTAPLARFVAEQGTALPKPFRRYAFGSVWRDEKPGPGRFREFTQCDADTVGSAGPKRTPRSSPWPWPASRPPACRRGGHAEDQQPQAPPTVCSPPLAVAGEGQRLAVLRAVDKLDRLGARGVADLLGRGRLDESGAFTRGAELDASAADRVLAFLAAGREQRAATLDSLSNVVGGSAEGDEGLRELSDIGAALDCLGVEPAQATFDPSVVRGLEYYTGAVFEAELQASGGARSGRWAAAAATTTW